MDVAKCTLFSRSRMFVESQVQSLLAVPPPDAVQRFFRQVLKSSPGLEVRDAGEGKGKGVFATRDFSEGSVLICEPPLVGIQHTANRPIAHVCSHCFRYLGSVEEQIGMRLAAAPWGIAEGSEEGSNDDSADTQRGSAGVPERVVLGLLSGTLRLPLSDQVPLPAAVPCPGGCEEDSYCSGRCAEAAWQQYHSLLCTGRDHSERANDEPAPGDKGKTVVQEPVAGAANETEDQRRRRAEVLHEFCRHADETNDVFRLAAKVLATVLLQAQRLVVQHGGPTAPAGEEQQREGKADSRQPADSSSSSGSGGAAAGADPGQCWAALQAAWEPFAMGHKAVWWECVAVPDDVTIEAEFRLDMQQLAADSLELLTAAIHDPRFPALFDLRVWGSIIGMFELNNLNLFVPSPVQRWQGLIEALPEGELQAAVEEAGAVLEAVEQFDEEGCEGNAFYTLQSCVNHSCSPNAHAFKRDEDTDGSAVILALHNISAGEEVTISYIDEEAPLEERAGELADYGFACACEKCAAEQLAAELLAG